MTSFDGETALNSPLLWTQDGFIDDEWRHGESLDSNHKVILPLASWLDLDDQSRHAARDRVGVHILPGEALDPILAFLPDIALVSLAFPAFSDGRSYSKAELLRARHGYRGIVRASGDVLIDQIPLMLRTGFDQFEIVNETAIARLRDDRTGGLPLHYQPAARASAAGQRFSWRRIPAA